MGVRTVVLVGATMLLAAGEGAAETGDLLELLGPAGAAIFGAGAVWARLNNKLVSLEGKVEGLETDVAELTNKVKLRRQRHLELKAEVDQLRGGLRVMHKASE